MRMRYGVMAVSPEIAEGIEKLDSFPILATTWYEDEPSQADIDGLLQEYRTDPELGMVGVPFTLLWRADPTFNDNLRRTLGLPEET